MKKNTFLLIFWLLPFFILAQPRGNDMNSLIEKYGKLPYTETIDIAPALLGALLGNNTGENFAADISLLKILTITKNDETRCGAAKNLQDEADDILQNGYSRLMNVKSEGEKLTIYLRNEKPQELIMIADDQKDITLMCIRGDISQTLIKAVLNGEISVKNK